MIDLGSLFPFFSGIVDETFRERLTQLPVRKFPQGMVIFDQGERGEEIYGVVEGAIEILRQQPEGDYFQVAVLEKGAIFGEFSFLTGSARSTAAVAMDPVTLVEMPAGWLSEVSRDFPELRERLVSLYRKRVLTNLLRNFKVFKGLSIEEIEDLSSRMKLQRFSAQDLIVQQGSHDLDLYVIKKGHVEVTKNEQDKELMLGQLKAGEVFGEMAIVTGEPRSASIRAIDEVEVMILPEEGLRASLAALPKLLKGIEDIARSRAAETRKALDSLVQDVMSGDWADSEEIVGILVDGLRLSLEWCTDRDSGKGKLQRTSQTFWTFEALDGAPNLAAGEAVEVFLRPGSMRKLSSIVEDVSFSSVVSSVRGKTVQLQMVPQAADAKRLTDVVTFLARERMKLFVYPEYEVEKLMVSARLRAEGQSEIQAPILTLSQTQGKVAARGMWNPGEMAEITLFEEDREVLHTKALCLSEDADAREFQFEYETSEEKSLLETFLRGVARNLGFGQVLAPASMISKAVEAHRIVLTKRFRSPQEFLRSYMSSIEAGLLRLESKDRIAPGKAVRVQLLIGKKKGVRSIGSNGLVRDWVNGMAEVELEGATTTLKEHAEWICRRLMEDQTHHAWEKRKEELTQAPRVPSVEAFSSWPKRMGLAAGVLITLLMVYGAWRSFRNPPPLPSPITPSQTHLSKSAGDAVLKFNATDGEIEIKASEIRTLKLNDQDGLLTVKSRKKNFSVDVSQMDRLTPFQRKQVELFKAQKKAQER